MHMFRAVGSTRPRSCCYWWCTSYHAAYSGRCRCWHYAFFGYRLHHHTNVVVDQFLGWLLLIIRGRTERNFTGWLLVGWVCFAGWCVLTFSKSSPSGTIRYCVSKDTDEQPPQVHQFISKCWLNISSQEEVHAKSKEANVRSYASPLEFSPTAMLCCWQWTCLSVIVKVMVAYWYFCWCIT